MDRVEAIARDCDAQAACSTADEVLLSAGGSAIFDLVADAPEARARPAGARPAALGLLRHARPRQLPALSSTPSSLAWLRAAARRLRPGARGLGARCSRCPEPGLAILAVGRRDLSFDIELPMPIARAPRVARRRRARVPASWKITALNDQHAYLRWDARGRSARARRSANASAWASRTPAPPSTSGTGCRSSTTTTASSTRSVMLLLIVNGPHGSGCCSASPSCATRRPRRAARSSTLILEDPDRVLDESFEPLAQRAQQLGADVMRTCRDLGFAGLREFKLALAQELALGGSPLHRRVNIERQRRATSSPRSRAAPRPRSPACARSSTSQRSSAAVDAIARRAPHRSVRRRPHLVVHGAATCRRACSGSAFRPTRGSTTTCSGSRPRRRTRTAS